VLTEGSVAVLFLKLVAIEVFSCRLTPTHEEQVVAPQTRGICNYEKTIYTHGSRDAPNVEGMGKVGVVSLHPYQDVSKTGTEEV
jgi:hypothetical protein